MSTNCEAGRYIDFSADYDMDRDILFIAYRCSTCQSINFNADRDLNLNICHDINSSAVRHKSRQWSRHEPKHGLLRHTPRSGPRHKF